MSLGLRAFVSQTFVLGCLFLMPKGNAHAFSGVFCLPDSKKGHFSLEFFSPDFCSPDYCFPDFFTRTLFPGLLFPGLLFPELLFPGLLIPEILFPGILFPSLIFFKQTFFSTRIFSKFTWEEKSMKKSLNQKKFRVTNIFLTFLIFLKISLIGSAMMNGNLNCHKPYFLLELSLEPYSLGGWLINMDVFGLWW